MNFFKGLKVIELSSVLAGPAVGMFFAELGAEVIKVENRSQGGDMTRHWKVKNEDPESPTSAYFSAVNYKKKYLDLDLSEEADLVAFKAELKSADIFLNNMKSSSAKKFGLDHEAIKKSFPRLIHCELTGFKHEEQKVAFDAVLQAETGFLSINGSPGHPAKLPIAFIDLMAAHQMKEACLIALLERSKDDKGAHITCSLEESALASLANQASNQLMANHEGKPMGTLHPNIAPYGEIVQCKGGEEFMLAIGTDRHFQGLCEILDCIVLTSDSRYADNQSRVLNRKELLVVLAKKALLLEAQDFNTQCIEKSVPAGKVKMLKEVMQSQVAQEMLRTEKIEGTDTSRISSLAFHISR